MQIILLGDEKIVDMLIQNGANMDTLDNRMYTPLRYAIKFGNFRNVSNIILVT